MIRNIVIKNYILVENMSLDFSKGLQIITGETGAGKSILIGAIDIIFGKSADAGMIKSKEKPAYLEISIDKSIKNSAFHNLLQKYEIETTEDEVFFIREIAPSGRTKSFINGRRVSISIMKEFRKAIIDFHSQRDQLLLLNRNYQLEVLDKYGKLEALCKEFQMEFKHLKKTIETVETLRNEEKENQERKQLYAYQVKEIEELNPLEGEDKELLNEMNLLENAEEILELSSQMEEVVYESDDSVYDKMNSFLIQLAKYESDTVSIKNAVEALRESLQAIEDAVFHIKSVRDVIDLDEERKKMVKERLDSLNKLTQKYKLSLSEIIDYKTEIQKKLEQFSSLSEKIIQVENAIYEQQQKVLKIADLLSKKRKKAAFFLTEELEKNLQKLAIPHAKVDIKIDKIVAEKDGIKNLVEMSVFGNDKVEFYFSANPGMQLESLQNAASGGELSRFLLTIKKIVSDTMDSIIIIFDEIDTGIGGRTAEFMGNFIREIAKHHQVFCLTHLAAIASFADEHFRVEKMVSHDATKIHIKTLNETEKKRELARMISGEGSQHALNYAEEILKNKMVGKE